MLSCGPGPGCDQALAGKCVGSARAAWQAKYPETNPGSPRVSYLATVRGEPVCWSGSAKVLPLVITIWGPQHG